uniref:phospholipase D n=1 Tax=Davidia involucrata TaxID=16924 RepID=A0A5B7BP60_DAVIN
MLLVTYRSHHEKLVIVDYHICFIGGLDLCFGRYDTIEHKVGDYPPFIWPGKDYYNPRESEPNSWEDTMKDELERGKYPRMPWHDIHCALWGPPCRDAARHFVQRWNHAKRNKAPNEQTIPLLMPHHHMVIPHYMGRSREIDIEIGNVEVKPKDIGRQDSFSSWSPLQDIPLLLPQEADGLDASNINNNLNGLGMNQYQYHLDQPSRVGQSISSSFQKSKIEPLIPDMQMKGFIDDLDSMDLQSEMTLDAAAQSDMQISDDWWETQERGYQVVSVDETAQVGPRTPCRCQVIRSVSHWSAGTSQTEDSIHRAYCSLIEKAEHFVYIENQFFISGLSGDEIIQNRVLEALYRRIMQAHKEQKCFRVIIVIPLLPGFQGGLDDGGAATVRAIMHWQYRTISRGKNSILHNLSALLGPKTNDYISFYGLRTYGRLSDGGPVVTSQVYVHSKVMIIDDHIALVGSSNINDRSLLGSRDSEIGVLIEDKDFLESSMNGKPWKAGKFAFSLRLSLWLEHLGLHAGEISRIRDPVSNTTYKDLWLATAKSNTMIYQDVFACVPNDLIHSRSALRQSMGHWKEKLGNTTIDLGVAPEKLECCQDGEITVTDPMEKLKSVRGFLVSFPLEFMCQEDLRPVFSESEFYASPQVFH